MTDNISQILEETVTRLFANEVTHGAIEAFEQGKAQDGLWNQVLELGLTDVLSAEEDAPWGTAYPVLKACGRYSAPIPLAETAVARRLLSDVGIDAPDGVITIAEWDGLTLSGDSVSGVVKGVAWGRQADYLVLDDEASNKRLLIALAGVELKEGQNVAREPRDQITLSGSSVEASADIGDNLSLSSAGTLLRSCQMAGALQGLLEAGVQYVGEREQFGKPLSKFQAIQHQLAMLGGLAAAVNSAAQAACIAVDDGHQSRQIAIAKIQAGESVAESTSIAHQVHGAIGFTYEHSLHFLTRRLWSWRNEFGSTNVLALALGNEAFARGADQLWPDITAL